MDNPLLKIWTKENPELVLPCVDKTVNKPVGLFCPLDQKTHVPYISIGTTFQLTKEETDQCISIGKERLHKNVVNNCANRTYSGRDDEQIDIQGVIGEYAFCKMFGLPIEIWDTTCRGSNSEERFDAVFPNGWTVDVKTTIYENADIRVTPWKATNPPSLYGLMIITNYNKYTPFTSDRLPILVYKGLVTSKEVFNEKWLESQYSKGVNKQYYSVPQSEMKTFEEIKLTEKEPSIRKANNHRVNAFKL